MGVVFTLLFCSILPVWAAETAAFRRPQHRAIGWRLAWASIALATGVLMAGRREDDGYAAHDQSSRVEQVLWAGWSAGNVMLIAWAYGGRSTVARRGFPIAPLPPEKIVAKSDSGVGRGPGGPI